MGFRAFGGVLLSKGAVLFLGISKGTLILRTTHMQHAVPNVGFR